MAFKTNLILLLAVALTAGQRGIAAAADECIGNAGALGTSRTIVVDPSKHPRVGTMSYEETLPLFDKEVVLTFDDVPIHPVTEEVLDILRAECV